jgi:glutathione S-transferase
MTTQTMAPATPQTSTPNTKQATKQATAQPALILCELSATPHEAVDSWSPFCMKVFRALRAHGLAYASLRGAMPSTFAKHNPAAQVPVLLIDGAAVADSTEILRAIEDMTGRRSCAESWLWEEFADTTLNGFVVAARWADDDNWRRTKLAYFGDAPALVRLLVAPLVRRHVKKGLVARDVWRRGAAACWARFERILDHLEARAPEDGFWVAGGISAADFAIFGQLQALRTPLTVEQSRSVARRPRLSRYLDRVDMATREGARLEDPFVAPPPRRISGAKLRAIAA